MCNEILIGTLFLRCPCWSLCQVFSWKHPHCLMWTFILLPLCLWFSLSFWLLQVWSLPTKGRRKQFWNASRLSKGFFTNWIEKNEERSHVFLTQHKYLWNILKNSNPDLVKTIMGWQKENCRLLSNTTKEIKYCGRKNVLSIKQKIWKISTIFRWKTWLPGLPWSGKDSSWRGPERRWRSVFKDFVTII